MKSTILFKALKTNCFSCDSWKDLEIESDDEKEVYDVLRLKYKDLVFRIDFIEDKFALHLETKHEFKKDFIILGKNERKRKERQNGTFTIKDEGYKKEIYNERTKNFK